MNNMNDGMININSNMMFQQNLFESNNYQNINSVNDNDCFEYNQKMEYLMGENSMYCTFCRKQLPASYQTFLFTGPEILIIILNRGKGIEFKVKMEFNEQLNLYNYITRKETGFMYNLIGVVTHLGESGLFGHFIAFCKSPKDNQWYQYNDDMVTRVVNFKQEIIDCGMPYILFYQKIGNI